MDKCLGGIVTQSVVWTPVLEKRGLVIVLIHVSFESRGIVLSVYCLWSAWFIAISSGFHLKP